MPLRGSANYDSVMNVRRFMFEDIEKTICLRKSNLGAPNFLLALGLCCYTEYWGKLLLGVRRDQIKMSEKAFNAFFERLGPEWKRSHYKLLTDIDSGIDVYSGVRYSLLCN